jgi:hypothetical protein
MVGIEPLAHQTDDAFTHDRESHVERELQRGAQQNGAEQAGTEPGDTAAVAAVDQTVDDELLKLQRYRRHRGDDQREADENKLLPPRNPPDRPVEGRHRACFVLSHDWSSPIGHLSASWGADHALLDPSIQIREEAPDMRTSRSGLALRPRRSRCLDSLSLAGARCPRTSSRLA